MPRVVLLTRPGCHLCGEARDVVRRVCAQTGTAWTERSILDDPADEAAYWDTIPVVLVDGAVREALRVDAARLADVLSGEPGARHSWWRGSRR